MYKCLPLLFVFKIYVQMFIVSLSIFRMLKAVHSLACIFFFTMFYIYMLVLHCKVTNFI